MKMENIEDSYPLSPLQQGMLFHSLYAPGSGVDIEQIVCTLHENLNVSVFEQAWQRVIERHPVLRTAFRWKGLDQPIQEVHKQVRCPLEQEDLRRLSKKEQETRLNIYLQADRRCGFELSEAPLMRLALFRCADAGYQFVWTFHHALLDGRSFPLVLKEVFTFYEAFCQGQDPQLEQPRPYRDYIEWLQQQDFIKAEAFWQQKLKGFTKPTLLVVGKTVARSLGDEGDYGIQQIQLPESLTSDLRSLAQRHQLTLNTLVQGAWALLLSRYSGEEEVVFGTTRACRRSALEGSGTESMVGLFINTLPVRIRVPPGMPVLTWLIELRAQSLTVRQYEHTPLVKIQEWSDVPWDVPLFESILVFENYLLNSVLRAQGGSWENREFRLLGQTNYPLTLAGYGDAALLLKLEYDRCRFEDAMISRMLGHMQTLLRGFVANPERRLLDVSLLTKAERHQLLVEWNDTKADYPQDRCIHQLFEVQVERTPDAIAVVFEDKQLTYQGLNWRANQLAHHLQALGVGPETLVGICMERSLEMVVGLMGILKAGAAYVPLDPAFPKERLAFMLEDIQSPVLLTQQRLVERLPEHQAHLICMDTDWEVIARESKENPVSATAPETMAYVLYTSGSTGRPKGVVIQHRSVSNLSMGLYHAIYAQQREAQLRISLNGPLVFDTSVKQLIQLLWGHTLYILPSEIRFDSEALVAYLQCHELDVFDCTPSYLRLLLAAGLLHKPGHMPGQVLVAGEAIDESTWQVLTQATKTTFYNLYGPTECTVDATVGQVQSAASRPIIGRPLTNTQIYLLDFHLQPVPIGVAGELYIGGDGLARGYLNRPELTAEKFIPNPFSDEPGARLYRTGDLARYLPDGNIEFLGRVDHQVKIRGFRIELEGIGAVLAQHSAVREVVVIAREDQPGDNRLVAYIVPNQTQALTTSELHRFLKEKLPEYMVPAAFVMLEALPLTPNGKVDRRALPDPDTFRREQEEGFVAPRTSTEEALADIWAEILGLEKVGIYDNFFELGGNSLLATRVVSRLLETFRLDLPLRSLFEESTVASLAECIETIRWAAQASQPPSRAKVGDREEIAL